MRRFLFSAVLLASVLVAHVPAFAQNEDGPRKNRTSEFSVSDQAYFLSGARDNLNHAASKESRQQTLQQLYPGFQKYPLFTHLCKEAAGSSGRSAISRSVFYAECQIARFESTDIIFPHHYYW